MTKCYSFERYIALRNEPYRASFHIMSEEELISSAQHGDARAFGQLYDTYVARIYRFILLKVSNRHDAEDLTSQVFGSAWESIRRFEFRGFPFSSWLYRIAQNAVIDHYRTTRHHEDLESVPDEVLADRPGWDERLDRDRDLMLVRSAIADLSPEHQTVLILRFIDERSTKEIALTIGKSEGAVRVIQHRALKELRQKIDARRPHHTTTEA
ncbi:MAG: sigma-70 family RNA polymerase sigma factor [bacterium]|nr:sigma-70 family RNA polymerase sigma factor [bacterium]